MLRDPHCGPSPVSDDREARTQDLVAQLLPHVQLTARRLAEALVDRPDDQLFGALEHELRDAAHDLATRAHQTGLDGRKKRGTKAPPASAPAVRATPASTPTKAGGS